MFEYTHRGGIIVVMGKKIMGKKKRMGLSVDEADDDAPASAGNAIQ